MNSSKPLNESTSLNLSSLTATNSSVSFFRARYVRPCAPSPRHRIYSYDSFKITGVSKLSSYDSIPPHPIVSEPPPYQKPTIPALPNQSAFRTRQRTFSLPNLGKMRYFFRTMTCQSCLPTDTSDHIGLRFPLRKLETHQHDHIASRHHTTIRHPLHKCTLYCSPPIPMKDQTSL